MIVYITHLTHECDVLGCTGRRAEVSSKSPQLACLPASARGYLAYSPRQRSPVEHGRVDQFYGMAPCRLFQYTSYVVSEEQRPGSLGSRQSRLGLEQQEPGRGDPLVKLENLTLVQ